MTVNTQPHGLVMFAENGPREVTWVSAEKAIGGFFL
jgi:hypothetical protein